MTIATTKVTKKDNFMALRQLVENLGDHQYDGLLEFIDKEIAALNQKATKAKERAAQKRAESDDLKEKVYNILTDTFKSGDEIVAELNDAEITKNRVVARLSLLIKEGLVIKEKQKNNKTSVTLYKKVIDTTMEE